MISSDLLTYDLDQHPLPPPAVEFAVENPLPGAKDFGEPSEAVEAAVRHSNDNLAAHNLPFQMRVGVVPSIPSGHASPVRLCQYWSIGACGASFSSHTS